MIYELTNDVAHITESGGYDAKLIEFEGWQDTPTIHPDVDEYARGLPNPVPYTGNLETLSWLDYPYAVPTSNLLISRRMLDVLLSVRHFPHCAFPARIYGSTVPRRPRDEPVSHTDAFVILKLMRFTDGCIDPDRTIVEGVPFRETGEEMVDPIGVEHYEFVEPEGGFPPVFLPREAVFYCYSEAAKAACEGAGLKGLLFRPVP